jgi:hypothetical protein
VVQSVSPLLKLFFAWRFFTLKMEAIRSSETSVITIPTRRHIPEDDILQKANLFFKKKSISIYIYIYIFLTGYILLQNSTPDWWWPCLAETCREFTWTHELRDDLTVNEGSRIEDSVWEWVWVWVYVCVCMCVRVTWFYPLSCKGVKLSLWPYRKSADWGWLGIGCWEE